MTTNRTPAAAAIASSTGQQRRVRTPMSTLTRLLANLGRTH